MSRRPCSIEGCDKPTVGRGYCSIHWQRWKRHGDPLSGRAIRGAGEAFLEMAVVSCTDECVIWPYGKYKSGYGSISLNGQCVKAHREVCRRVHGEPVFPRVEAAHGCGVRACINPRHLRWATHRENAHDKVSHGTLLRGERVGGAKLTQSQVLAIRASKASNRKAAVEFGVSYSAIDLIRRRKRWTHVEPN